MNDSGSGEPSTTKTTDLKTRLLQMQSQHERQARQIESQAFEPFTADLKNLLSDERRTLASDFDALRRISDEQREKIRNQIGKETRRMIWLLKFPLLLTVMACLAAAGLELAWFHLEDRQRVRMAPWSEKGKNYLIVNEPGWTLCTIATIPPESQGKTKTIIQQACRPVE
jgi:hypothetical protein